MYIDKGNSTENLELFQQLNSNSSIIEAIIGHELEWEELAKRQACRIAIYTNGSIQDSGEELSNLINWVVELTPKFFQAFMTVSNP